MIATTEKPQFRPCRVSPWTGRYGKTVGGCGWKVKSAAGSWKPIVRWTTDDLTLKCQALECAGTDQLATAVVAGKQSLGDSGGGSFVINEFGQVIVPSSQGDGRRVIVGEIDGGILIEDPLADSVSDKWFRIWETDGLEPGDRWEKPYVGVQYNLNKWSKIYYYRTSDEGGGSEFPISQDENLVRALRDVRRTGAVRFIVNPYGVVLTKKPAGDTWSQNEDWEAVYIGKINYKQWFRKES